MRALVRGLATSFANAVTMEPLANPISLELAQQQHDAYIQLLKQLLPGGVTELPADDKHPGGQVGEWAVPLPLRSRSTGQHMLVRTARARHRISLRCLVPSKAALPSLNSIPDCCFIEDTAVVAGGTAVITRIGAASRQGEEGPVAEALAALGCTVRRLQPPATLDGGDVLQLPGSTHILVGLSLRTNAEGVAQLAAALPNHSVHAVPVAAGLHLKSLVTALDASTLLLSDTPAGHGLSAELAALPGLAGTQLQHEFVPDPVCANVLLLGDRHVVTQVGSWGRVWGCRFQGLAWTAWLALLQVRYGCCASYRTALPSQPPHCYAPLTRPWLQGSDPTTEQLLDRLCAERGLQLHRLPRATEMIKADGALTCCSILLS